jgi:Ca-activated chloride channel family protein
MFVVDTSGSMAGKKLEQAKKALAFCVENLNSVDRFELLRFSTETEACFEKLTDVSRDTRARAQSWIEALKPTGGTAIYSALQDALKLRPSSNGRPYVVIFLTDGQPTVGETNEDRIVASVAREGGAPTRIFCFGIGTDVNTHLLDKIVERTRAASQYVLPDEDLEVKVSSFFTKIKEPLLTDLKITWPKGVHVKKAYPHPLPDLFRGDQLVLAGRYSGAGEGEVIIEGLVNGRPRRITQRVRFPERTSENEFIPRLWATRRVGWLLDEIRLRGENAELRDEVVQLARRYAIVTPYTSYLIVEDEARRGVPVAQRSLQNLDRNREGQEMLRESWSAFRDEKAGDAGARNAQAIAGMKNATAADAPVTLDAFQVAAASGAVQRGRAFEAASPALAAKAVAQAKQQIDSVQQAARNVAGKTFFQNGNQWLDSDVQRAKPAKTVRLQFASADYFKLLAEKPAAAEWLALGQNVQFTLGDTLYDIFE